MPIVSIVMMIAYVFVWIYVIQLLGRLVRAVEHIAGIIETSSKT